ncbi:Transmembrane protein [Vespula maculifrons]|uniref:Transmembrane protein n=1 Tax=Vespula maculifrons TaxID=7453 RepID=A0ABD2C9B5_VESMC
MALSRISRCPDLLTTFNRNLQPVGITSYPINKIQFKHRETVPRNQAKILHVTSVHRYPDPPTLPLPNNVSEIFANETGRFTPERTRDIASPILIYGANRVTANNNSFSFLSFSDKKESFNGQRNFPIVREDTHVDLYDCSGAISLNGSMQSNVPKPFCSTGKSTHFNMPGGQWAKDSKYIAEDMQKSHYRLSSINILSSDQVKNGIINEAILTRPLCNKLLHPIYIDLVRYSTNASTPVNTTNSEDEIKKKIIQTRKERFKMIVRDYGKVVIVFHVAISLISLGFLYTAVVSEIDLVPYIEKIYNIDNEKVMKVLNDSSGFLLAYTVHKMLAPIRLSITCGVTPWLVSYLRKKGILKGPMPKKQNEFSLKVNRYKN